MKARLGSCILAAGLLGLVGLPQSASAGSISIYSQVDNAYPGVDNNPAPETGVNTDLNEANTMGTIMNAQLSPWTGDPTPPTGSVSTAPYSCISCGTSGAAGHAYYAVPTGDTEFQLFWGSPDAYNQVVFWSGDDGTGTMLAMFTGSDLTPPAPGTGNDFVTWAFNGVTVGSVELIDTGTAAFEYADPLATTPLPATLPLFAGGLGLVGLLSRRKRKAVSALSAA
jgi:hypothetical protein